MANFFSSVPKGRFSPSRMAEADPRAVQIIQSQSRQTGSAVSKNLASKEYADASKALAMAQINLGNKPKYCSVPIGYKN